MDYIQVIAMLVFAIIVLAAIAMLVVSIMRTKHEHFNTTTASTTTTVCRCCRQSSTPRYCTGCHAQLPPALERPCPPLPKCAGECAKICNRKKWPLTQLEREDMHLYGYLVSLLSSMGITP